MATGRFQTALAIDAHGAISSTGVAAIRHTGTKCQIGDALPQTFVVNAGDLIQCRSGLAATERIQIVLGTFRPHDRGAVVVREALRDAVPGILGAGHGAVGIARAGVGHARGVVEHVAGAVEFAQVRADLLVLGRAVALTLLLGAGIDLVQRASADIGEASRIGVGFVLAVPDAVDDAVRTPSALEGALVCRRGAKERRSSGQVGSTSSRCRRQCENMYQLHFGDGMRYAQRPGTGSRSSLSSTLL